MHATCHFNKARDFLDCSTILQKVENVHIIPAISTDHSANVSYCTLTELRKQDSALLFLKFNSSLLEEGANIKVVTDEYSDWLEEEKIFKTLGFFGLSLSTNLP